MSIKTLAKLFTIDVSLDIIVVRLYRLDTDHLSYIMTGYFMEKKKRDEQ